MDITQELLTTINDDPDWPKKVIIVIIPTEASRRAKAEKSTSNSVKCEGFAHCFLRLQWHGA